MLVIIWLIAGTMALAAEKMTIMPASANNPWLKSKIEKDLKKPECEMDFDAESCLASLKKYGELIDKGNEQGEQLHTIHFKMFQSAIVDWARLKYFECDTNISKMWLKKIYKYFGLMAQYSQEMDIAEKSKNNIAFEKAKKIFNSVIDSYLKEIQKPEKPNAKIREQLRIQKFKEHKLYMEYLRKLQKGEAVEE